MSTKKKKPAAKQPEPKTPTPREYLDAFNELWWNEADDAFQDLCGGWNSPVDAALADFENAETKVKSLRERYEQSRTDANLTAVHGAEKLLHKARVKLDQQLDRLRALEPKIRAFIDELKGKPAPKPTAKKPAEKKPDDVPGQQPLFPPAKKPQTKKKPAPKKPNPAKPSVSKAAAKIIDEANSQLAHAAITLKDPAEVSRMLNKANGIARHVAEEKLGKPAIAELVGRGLLVEQKSGAFIGWLDLTIEGKRWLQEYVTTGDPKEPAGSKSKASAKGKGALPPHGAAAGNGAGAPTADEAMTEAAIAHICDDCAVRAHHAMVRAVLNADFGDLRITELVDGGYLMAHPDPSHVGQMALTGKGRDMADRWHRGEFKTKKPQREKAGVP